MSTKTNTLVIADVLSFIGIEAELRYAPKDGPVTVIPVHDIMKAHPEMIRQAMIGGLFGRLGNISKGGLTKALEREATDKDLLAARNSTVKNWLDTGMWATRGGGGDQTTSLMWDALYEERGADTDLLRRKVKSECAAKVHTILGKDTDASFANFLAATATELAKASGRDREAINAALLAKYTKAAEAIRERQAKALAAIEIDVDALLAGTAD